MLPSCKNVAKHISETWLMTFNWLFLEISDFFLTQHLLTAPTDSIIKLYFLHMQLLG